MDDLKLILRSSILQKAVHWINRFPRHEISRFAVWFFILFIFLFNFVSKLLVFLYSLDLLQTYWGRIWWLQDCLVMYEKQRLQIYFLKVSQIWQENNCVGILLWWSYSSAKFAKFLRELFLQNILLGIVSNISF